MRTLSPLPSVGSCGEGRKRGQENGVRQVVPVAGPGGITADVVVEPTLAHLQWRVPDYESIQAKALFFGSLTGLVRVIVMARV
ncbi:MULTISPECIES: hypothetical protein [Geobacter]|uniref:hypothetical protein n=1 Tax=Geobacter TaxID=28231 RepID=UPI0025731B83|nr:hypothetical protein [Geobacter sulfurreducens]